MPITIEPCYKNLIKCPVCQDYSYLIYPCEYYIENITIKCPNCDNIIKIVIHKNKDTYEII